MSLLPLIGLLALVGVVGLFLILRSRAPSQSIEERLNELAASGQSFTLEEIELAQPFSHSSKAQ